ncbi:MAG: polysaccharide deacetylase family protein [Actinomycetota bacterium]
MILTYHSVLDERWRPWIDPTYGVTARQFERHVAFLAKHRNVISMSELEAYVADGRTPPKGSVVITFDDGYLNNLTTAAPILARAGLPATFYLATGYVSERRNQWIDTVFVAFRRRRLHHLEFGGHRYDLGAWSDEQRAHAALCNTLLPASLPERREILDDVRRQLKPDARPPALTMGWRDVQALKAFSADFEFGAHTRHHLDLSALPRDEVKVEVADSVADVEDELDQEVRHFSYPFGRLDSSGGEVIRELGLSSAVLTEPAGAIGAGSNLHALPRQTARGRQLLFRSRATIHAPLMDRSAVNN